MLSREFLLFCVILALASKSAFATPILSLPSDAAKTWALLVAGSDTYENYRYLCYCTPLRRAVRLTAAAGTKQMCRILTMFLFRVVFHRLK
jgi:hypothetical protein